MLRIQKRKIIGGEFIEVFAEEARKLDGIEFLAQGTIWPDILESEDGIKAHHNAGGLPHGMVYRQPFPGPGLGVRCPGAITHEVPGINRVLYDFTPKPTGTVEFE